MVTKHEAMTESRFIFHTKNGKCKTWKRSPDAFSLPIKHGLYQNGYLDENNAHQFTVDKG